MSVSAHQQMERFTTSIEGSLRTGNWFAALFLALALPDICAALEQPTAQETENSVDTPPHVQPK